MYWLQCPTRKLPHCNAYYYFSFVFVFSVCLFRENLILSYRSTNGQVYELCVVAATAPGVVVVVVAGGGLLAVYDSLILTCHYDHSRTFQESIEEVFNQS